MRSARVERKLYNLIKVFWFSFFRRSKFESEFGKNFDENFQTIFAFFLELKFRPDRFGCLLWSPLIIVRTVRLAKPFLYKIVFSREKQQIQIYLQNFYKIGVIQKRLLFQYNTISMMVQMHFSSLLKLKVSIWKFQNLEKEYLRFWKIWQRAQSTN